MAIDFPDDFFLPPDDRPANWTDDPHLRACVDWFRDCMTAEEWKARRNAAAARLYDTALGRVSQADPGRFFAEADIFGWYLFLCDANLDHPWNYEPMFGSRVVPVFQAIGRNLELLQAVEGATERARRIVFSDRAQPNGGIFELLVAAAYAREDYGVRFLSERPGISKTCDLEIDCNGESFAVECKRMETSEYGNAERVRMRQLWTESSRLFSQAGLSVFCEADFDVPIDSVPNDYLIRKATRWLSTGSSSTLEDEIGSVSFRFLDLSQLHAALETDSILAAGTRLLELLTGKYIRHANYFQAIKMRLDDNPRYITDCTQAVLLKWSSRSNEAIDRKARDVFRKLVEANRQLPDDLPGIIHIGFEAVDGDDVEQRRHSKIYENIRGFDPKGSRLSRVYCHYFVPESPPQEAWAFDETCQHVDVGKSPDRVLNRPFLVLPSQAADRDGPHWGLLGGDAKN